jgi:hypothetical protein
MLVLMTMGLHSVGSYLKSALLYLLSAIVASVAGAAFYKEP